MSNYTAKIQAQKDAVERMKVARSKAEATKEQLEKQRDQLTIEFRTMGEEICKSPLASKELRILGEKLRTLNIEQIDLPTELAELDTLIVENIAKVDMLIPERFKGAR